MIDHGAARTKLMQVVDAAVEGLDGPSVQVYPSAIDALAAFPCIVGGQPKWVADEQPCMDKTIFPIAVVVARPGTSNDAHTVALLEALWPVVVSALRVAIDDDQTLGGVCAAATIDRADFGLFNIQGNDYPAQSIFVELFG